MSAINTTLSRITDLSGTLPGTSSKEGKKQMDAAQNFEALLIGQMLRSMHQEGSGWLETGDDDAGATALAFGEDQLAKAIAQGGGLGLSKIIAAGLKAKAAAAEKSAT